MDPTLLAALIQQVFVPVIASIVRAHVQATNGQTPTDAQVIAALGTDTANFANIGMAFLTSKGVTVPAPLAAPVTTYPPQPPVVTSPA